MDLHQASEHIERELLIMTRHREMTSSRRTRPGDYLDRSAYVLLSRLEVQGPMSIAEFVEAFGLAASTFTRQTNALLKDGLLERMLDPDGGLARKLRITGNGAKRLAWERNQFVAGLADVFVDWPPERLANFVADLQQFNTDIERLTGRPWPRG
jgi:DNA-binding MarR family transcriptional regulator